MGRARYRSAGGKEWVVPYGLAPGSSDLIGWTRDGVFLAIEVKTPRGRLTAAQAAFLSAVAASGGRAGCARSEDEALAIADGLHASAGSAGALAARP